MTLIEASGCASALKRYLSWGNAYVGTDTFKTVQDFGAVILKRTRRMAFQLLAERLSLLGTLTSHGRESILARG